MRVCPCEQIIVEKDLFVHFGENQRFYWYWYCWVRMEFIFEGDRFCYAFPSSISFM